MEMKYSTRIVGLFILFVFSTDVLAWNQPPVADLEAVPPVVKLGCSVLLDGSASYDPDGWYIAEYRWRFGDGSSGYFYGGETRTYTYSEPGTYTAWLRVKDNKGAYDYDTCTVYVSVDSDNDDMPDGWEELYGLDTGIDDAEDDFDDDSYNNLCEYLHGSDPNDNTSLPSSNTTIAVPAQVSSIQRAINASIEGDTVVVSEGRYYENINFNGKKITLTGTNPDDWSVIAATIIDGGGSGSVVTFDSGDANSVITGFTITGGNIGIDCSGTSPNISNCMIVGNK